MAINSVSPGTVPTSFLIADYGQAPGGSPDSIPLLTQAGGKPVSVGLEIQSTLGGILFPRMTTTQRNALNTTNGMMVYNITSSTFDIYVGGSWTSISSTVIDSATFILKTATALLPNAQSLGALTTGLLKNTVSVSVGTLSTAVPGTDYYSMGAPTTLIDTSNVTTDNLFVGTLAGNTSVSGSNNTAVGVNAMTGITSGIDNTSVGFQAGVDISSGGSNSLFGYQSGMSIKTSPANSFFGAQSGLEVNTVTGGNSGFGYQALTLDSTAVETTAIGAEAGSSRTGYANCTFLGYNADASVNNLTNATAIGASASVSISNALVLGNSANVGIGTSSPAEPLHVVGNTRIDTGLLNCSGGIANTHLTYTTGTASSTGGIVTGIGVTFVGDFVGGIIQFANGQYGFITELLSSTQLVLNSPVTVTAQAYTIYYGGFTSVNGNNGYASFGNLYLNGPISSIFGFAYFQFGAISDGLLNTGNGLASQSGTTVTGSAGASFTSDMVGGIIYYPNILTGTTPYPFIITGYTSSTSLTVSGNFSTGGAVNYEIIFGGFSSADQNTGIYNLFLSGAGTNGLNIAGYVPSVLNYYEEITLSGNWTGAQTIAGTIYVVRIGKMVTMRVAGLNGTATGSAVQTFGVVIPARFLPTTTSGTIEIPARMLSNNVAATGMFIITTSTGSIVAFPLITGGGGWTSGQTWQIYETGTSWTVQ